MAAGNISTLWRRAFFLYISDVPLGVRSNSGVTGGGLTAPVDTFSLQGCDTRPTIIFFVAELRKKNTG